MTKPSLAADETRFRVLFEAHSRAILGYALRRTSDPGAAADVVGETFLVAWRRMTEVPPDEQARLWLFGVARRVLANQRRGDLRRSRLAEKLGVALRAQVRQPDDAGGDEHVGAHDDRRRVRAALECLDEDDREVLRLTSWEGLTPSEVAVVMAISPGTARSRLHRARRRLQARLEADGFGGERSGRGGHVVDDERVLVRDAECET